jgi:hypothetical protein
VHAEQANRARHTCRQGHKKGTPSAASLLVAGWVLVCTPLAPAVLTAQTIMALSRCRWQGAIAIQRWKSVRDVDALRAKATSPLAAVWLHGTLQIPPDLVVKFYPVDIFEVIRDLMRRLNVAQRLCSNRKSRGELLATSPTHWFTTKLDGM